jgi:hypothetical protein
MEMLEVAREYAGKTDQELLRLALALDNLTDEARAALAAEMARRRIDDPKHIETARQEERERKSENDRDLGTLGFSLFLFSGRMRFGKANFIFNPDTGAERFATTVFIVLLCFPLIPTGTYLVERKRGTNRLNSLERLPLDWEQILKIWIVSAGSIVGSLWLIRALSYSGTVRHAVRRLLA